MRRHHHWSPLRHWNIGPGKSVGIVGIGGLGHMGVKLAHALGAHVVAFTTSESKRGDAFKLGADEVVVSRNADEMAAQAGSRLHHQHRGRAAQPGRLSGAAGRGGTMTLVGCVRQPHPSPSVASLICGRRSLAGSLIGGIKETQEMLDFCAEHDIVADIEMSPCRTSRRPSRAC